MIRLLDFLEIKWTFPSHPKPWKWPLCVPKQRQYNKTVLFTMFPSAVSKWNGNMHHILLKLIDVALPYLKCLNIESTCTKYVNLRTAFKWNITQHNSTLIIIVTNQPHCNTQINLPQGNVIRNANFVNTAHFLKVMYAFTEKNTKTMQQLANLCACSPHSRVLECNNSKKGSLAI